MADRNFVDEYAKIFPEYKKLEPRLEQLLRDLLADTAIKVHALEIRVKTPESFGEKINRNGKSYAEPLKEITDLVGARIILYYIDDIDLVCRLLDSEFAVDSAKSVDKRETLATDQVGYLSVHKILSLSPQRTLLREWSHWKGLQFEVQVRTVLQHSWAAIDHALRYKVKSDVPKASLRRLMRLSGLLELADQEFAQLRKEQDQAIVAVADEFGKGNNTIGIDLFSVDTFIRSTVVAQTVGKAADDAGIRVANDADNKGDSHLAAVASVLRFGTIADLDVAIKDASKLAYPFFERFMSGEVRYQTGGSIGHFLAVLLAGYKHDSLRLADLSAAVTWSDDYCKRALAAGAVFQNEQRKSGDV